MKSDPKFNMKFNSIILLILVTLPFMGCATKKVPKNQGPKTYDQSVEDEFSSIENSQKDVLEYYRRLRQKNWQSYKEQGKKRKVPYRVWRKKNRARHQRIVPRSNEPTPTKKLAPIPRPKPLAASIVKEMKIEIRQYMSYFCMEKRKSSRFDDSADCNAFTENILNECEAQYTIITDRSLVKCVKRKLK